MNARGHGTAAASPANRTLTLEGVSLEAHNGRRETTMGNEPKKPDFSNVQGGADSSAPPAPAKADFGNVQSGVESSAPSAGTDTQSYTVAKGDNLSKIARHFYGNANEWRRIFDANRDQLDNPDLIKPGQVLKIPAKS
jgi:nucleoid-associated protein YgaU